MSSKLRKLIFYWEEEQASLTAQLSECLAEAAYSMANRYSKSLAAVNHELQILYSLENDIDYKIKNSIRVIDRIERLLASQNPSFIHPSYAWELAAERRRLDKLMFAAETAKKTGGTVLNELLGGMLAGKIDTITLVFSELENICCNVRLVRRTLILTIPEVRRHRANHVLYKKNSRQLKTLGFKLYDDKDKLMAFLPCSNQVELRLVKTMLAQITFEVFPTRELPGKSFIKYTEKGGY